MPALRIDAVDVLEHAVLLDDEDADAQAVEVVNLDGRQLREASEAPGDQEDWAPAGACPRVPLSGAGVTAFARCSHVSTTVSGLSDIDSMPSCISHSARSG